MRATNSMFGCKPRLLVIALASLTTYSAHAQGVYKVGRPATAADVASWNLDVAPDGKSLPAGSGSVKQGREVYAAQCAACHGATGEGGAGDRLSGGIGTLATPKPVRTVGSYWPYATTLFDYIRRAMPLHAPQSLTASEVYAVTGYVLFLNGVVQEDATMDARTLSGVKMPNRDGFVSDPRPDVKSSACYRDCLK